MIDIHLSLGNIFHCKESNPYDNLQTKSFFPSPEFRLLLRFLFAFWLVSRFGSLLQAAESNFRIPFLKKEKSTDLKHGLNKISASQESTQAEGGFPRRGLINLYSEIYQERRKLCATTANLAANAKTVSDEEFICANAVQIGLRKFRNCTTGIFDWCAFI